MWQLFFPSPSPLKLATIKAYLTAFNSTMPISPEHLPPSERLELKLNLRSQYESLRRAFNEAGILQILPSEGELGIVGIDPEHPDMAREYPLPSLESIQAKIKERAEELEVKVNQGFTKLLLVPAASPLSGSVENNRPASGLAKVYADQLLFHHQNRGKTIGGRKLDLLDSDGKPTDLDQGTPLWTWDAYQNADSEGKIVYYPKQFDQKNHGGITKQELVKGTLNTSFPGWQVRLVEDLPNLPGQGQGKTIGGRKQVEANQTPMEYLKQSQTQKEYINEEGATPEEWLALATLHLKETNQVLDDYQGKGKLSYLTGAYFPASGSVPGAYWDRNDRRAGLSGGDPGGRDEDYSVRRSVGV